MLFKILSYLCLLLLLVVGYWAFVSQAVFWSKKLIRRKTAPPGIRFFFFLFYLGALGFLLKGIYEKDPVLIVIWGCISLSQVLFWEKRWKLWWGTYITRKNLIGILFLLCICVAGWVYSEEAYHEYQWRHARPHKVIGYIMVTEKTEEIREDSLLRKNIGVQTKQTHIVLDNGEKISLQDARNNPDDKCFFEIGDSVRVDNNVIIFPI